VLPDDADAWEDVVLQLLRIGFDDVRGVLDGGVEAWRRTGRPVRSYATADVDALCAAYERDRVPVLDVRQQAEWEAGHASDARHVFLGDLPNRLGELPRTGELWTACASGYRASIAASLLDGAEIPVRLLASGGVPDWLERCPVVETMRGG